MENEIEVFFQELSYRLDIVREANLKINRYVAPQFNVLNLMYIDENKISDLVAFLLDFNAVHGQGNVFFRIFLEIVGINIDNKVASLNNYKVIREAQTYLLFNSMRRMDILVDFGVISLAIENKLWAGEQENQLADYCLHLSKSAHMSYLIFLTPDGHLPNSINTDSGEKNVAVSCLSYDTIYQWLITCANQCDSERVRWFVKDFASYINSTFSRN
jgi:hypothetical protein